MILRARFVVPMDGAVIEEGAVVVAGNEIVWVGSAAEVPGEHGGEVLDLGEVALMPGLINAHTHLDYTLLRGAIQPPRSFTAWVQRLNAIKRSLDSDDYRRAIARGFAELQKWGTTTVCNIESFPELMPDMPTPPIRTWWFYEMIDVRHRITTEEVVAGALEFFQHRGGPLANFGLSPHAPFTASIDLYHRANDCARALNMPLTTHVAESSEEFEMFSRASGPLHSFLTSILRPMTDAGGTTPFAHLWRSGAISRDWLLVHMNELSEEDFALLEQAGPEGLPHMIHCPGSHRYFGHSPFEFQRLHQIGVNICVATDSLASTDSLSLLGELRRLGAAEPWLSPEQLLRTVTVNPARALNRADRLGKIAPGALADLIAVPASGSVQTVHEEIVRFERPIPWMMIDGQVRS